MTTTVADLPSNPIEGDPTAVKSMAEHYRSIAEAISQAAGILGKVDKGQTSSKAVDAFVAKAGDLADKLRKTHGRYSGTGDALLDYSAALANAIAEAEPAAAAHNSSASDLGDAEQLQTHYQQLADAATDPTQQQEYQTQADSQGTKASGFRSDTGRYAAIVAQAKSDRDRAAERAISRIDDSTDDGLNDGWFDKFKHWMKENDGWISVVLKVAQWVGTALAIAALFFPLTAPFAWIGLGVMALAFVGDSAKAVAGTGSWLDVGMDAIGILTLGTGKLAVSAARASTDVVMMSRVSGLVRDGDEAATATTRVARSFNRIPREGIRPAYRMLTAGDEDLAHMMQWIDRSRVGVPGQSAEAVANLTTKLRFGQSLAVAGLSEDLFGEIKGFIPGEKDIDEALTARVAWGNSW
jgi:hypothetical protein